MSGRDQGTSRDTETRSGYPRGWAGNTGFAGWKIAVAAAMILGVPATIWLFFTIFFR